jgi:Na+/H+ antiporter NhaC
MRLLLLLVALLPLSALAADTPAAGPSLEWPQVRLYVGATVDGVKLHAAEGTWTITGLSPAGEDGPVVARVEGKPVTLPTVLVRSEHVQIQRSDRTVTVDVPTLAGIWSLLPAFLAIALALITRQVLPSLLGGVWLGVALLTQSPLDAFPGTLDLVVSVAADKDKLKVIIFTLAMGAMVGVVAAAGGSKGIVHWVSRFANTPRSGALSTWMMGMVVFFDDYASTLLVGSTMRPIADKLKLSREKLSYIVDSTAAPIASIALVSTWIGYEVSTLGDSMKAAGIEGDPYSVFISGIPSRFYPIYALLFVAIVAISRKDFGPMLKAEVRARKTGKLIRDGGKPLMDASLVEDQKKLEETAPRPLLAVIPVISLVALVLICLAILGADASYDALLYASCGSALIAAGLAVGFKALTLTESIDALISGVRAMVLAIFVLVLAWAIGKVMGDLKAGAYVASLIGGAIPAWTLATLTFLLAALMALATGTSWGTMAVLFPIVIPVAAQHMGAPGFEDLLIGVSSAVLAGAVFGDHCSPISDTTVLSSIACSSDHVDHTRTQAPYAIVCGTVAILLGTIPASLGVPAWLLLPVGIAALVGIIHLVGKRADDLAGEVDSAS